MAGEKNKSAQEKVAGKAAGKNSSAEKKVAEKAAEKNSSAGKKVAEKEARKNSAAEKKVTEKNAPKNSSAEREVVLGVLVHCCNKCITTVKKAEYQVEGVNSVTVRIQENTDKDLVTVKGTRELDVDKLVEYVKTKLNRKHVVVVSSK